VVTQDFERKTKQLIDSLKGICASYGLGNDGNEFKIITQVFLYKFLNGNYSLPSQSNQLKEKFQHNHQVA
jgi:type I restriction enzyme M protein